MKTKSPNEYIYQDGMEKVLDKLPAVGRKITIKIFNKQRKKSPLKRKGIMLQKIYMKSRSNFTVEVLVESGLGNRGKYRINFDVTDLLMGSVKISEME